MIKDSFLARLQSEVLTFDGAMGTMLQASGASPLACPELYVLKHPELVESIHQGYVSAGCDIIQTNTFGGNRLKLANFGLGDLVREINLRAAALALRAGAGKCLVAGSIGPTGVLLEPLGSGSFEQVYAVFREQAQALVEGGVHLINIETMTDIHEAKIAVIAVKDVAPHVPVICSLTYGENLRTMTGADPETAAAVFECLGVSMIGVNCGSGPEHAAQVLSRLYRATDVPLLAKPNAGVPRLVNRKTTYSLDPMGMATLVPQLISAGANMVGGCCGTSPAHLALIKQKTMSTKPLPRLYSGGTSKLAGSTSVIHVGGAYPTRVIGERINPTARKLLATALHSGDYDYIAQEAVSQCEQGAEIVDVNVGVGRKDSSEAEHLRQSIWAIQRVVGLPISIDTTSISSMEEALKVCRGKPLLNSTNGDDATLDNVLGLAKRYGAAVIGLTLDVGGIPLNAHGRIAVAKKIVDRALSLGLRREDIYIDALTLTAGVMQRHVLEAIEVIQAVKRDLCVPTVLGVSNISHGLPHRPILNNVFLAIAMSAGLDAAIINPGQEGVRNTILAGDVLTSRDINAHRFVSQMQRALRSTTEPPDEHLSASEILVKEILVGNRTRVGPLVYELLNANTSPLDIIGVSIVPAMELAGQRYEQGVYFLPQLLLSAEATQHAFSILESHLSGTSVHEAMGTIVLATVKGDVHDVGKNIVGLLLKTHGFNVIDLGKDVAPDNIITAAIAHNADIIALSALMTTTMPQMEEVAARIKLHQLNHSLLLGGAVVTDDYAKSIGGYYGRDAVSAVRVAKLIMGRKGVTRQ